MLLACLDLRLGRTLDGVFSFGVLLYVVVKGHVSLDDFVCWFWVLRRGC